MSVHLGFDGPSSDEAYRWDVTELNGWIDPDTMAKTAAAVRWLEALALRDALPRWLHWTIDRPRALRLLMRVRPSWRPKVQVWSSTTATLSDMDY